LLRHYVPESPALAHHPTAGRAKADSTIADIEQRVTLGDPAAELEPPDDRPARTPAQELRVRPLFGTRNVRQNIGSRSLVVPCLMVGARPFCSMQCSSLMASS